MLAEVCIKNKVSNVLAGKSYLEVAIYAGINKAVANLNI